jgi:MYXO-CTERM domain-containing protein
MATRIARHAAALFTGLVLSASQAQAAIIPFAISVTDVGAASTFGFTFALPATFSGLVDVTAELHITVNDARQDGASATGKTGTGLNWLFAGQGFASSTSFGVDLGPSCIAGAGASTTCDFSGSNTVSWDALDTGISALVSFLGSGGEDTYSISGFLNVVEHVDANVPEPAGWLLAGLGLAAAAAVRRRRPESLQRCR